MRMLLPAPGLRAAGGRCLHRADGCYLLVVLCLAASAAWGRGEAVPPPFDTRERLHQPLGPLAEKALAGLAEAAEPDQRELLTGHMANVIDGIQAELDLTEAERKVLSLDAMSLVGTALKTWRECVAVDLRPLLREQGGDDDASRAACVGTWKAAQLVPYFVVRHWVLPDRHPHWQKALERRLGATRAAVWQAAYEKVRAGRDREVDLFLKHWASACHAAMEKQLEESLRILLAAVPEAKAQADDLTAKARKLVADHAAAEMEAGRDMLESLPDHVLPDYLSRASMNSRFVSPTAEELEAAWLRLVVEVAGEAKGKAWAAAVKSWREKEEGRIAELLRPSDERAMKEMKQVMDDKVDEVVNVLEREAECRSRLEAMATQAMADNLAAARVKWRSSLLEQEKTEGRQLVRAGFDLAVENDVLECAAWQEGLQKLLSADELVRLEQSRELRRKSMNRALAKATVMEMDQRLGLNIQQRMALEPLVEPHMPGLLVRKESSSEWSLHPTVALDAVQNVSETELQAILEEEQMARWTKLASMGWNETPPPSPMDGDPFAPAAPPAVMVEVTVPDGEAAPQKGEEASVADEVNSYLYARMVIQRDETLRPMLSLVDDIARVLKLSPERKALLATAAKGAVEAVMTPWCDELSKRTQEEVEAATPETLDNVVEIVVSIHMPIRKKQVMEQPVWKQGLETLLNPAERETWQKMLAERQAYRVSTLAMLATVETDRRHLLGQRQFEKLEKIMEESIREDLSFLLKTPDCDDLNGWQWTSRFALMPLGNADKAELQAVLSPRQWERLQAHQFGEAVALWQHLKNMSEANDGQMPNADPPLNFFAE